LRLFEADVSAGQAVPDNGGRWFEEGRFAGGQQVEGESVEGGRSDVRGSLTYDLMSRKRETDEAGASS